MKTVRLGRPLRHLLVIALVMLAPCVVHAGLLGDTVTATLLDQTSTNLFTSGTSAQVTTGGPEFQGTVSLPNGGPPVQASWSLDLTDTGFTLTGVCSSNELGCNFDSLTLSISDLDFDPPGNLLSLTGITGALAFVAGSPQITASSVEIQFQFVELGSVGPLTQTYSATFVVTDAPAVPLPATVALLAIGALAIGYRRRFARS